MRNCDKEKAAAAQARRQEGALAPPLSDRNLQTTAYKMVLFFKTSRQKFQLGSPEFSDAAAL